MITNTLRTAGRSCVSNALKREIKILSCLFYFFSENKKHLQGNLKCMSLWEGNIDIQYDKGKCVMLQLHKDILLLNTFMGHVRFANRPVRSCNNFYLELSLSSCIFTHFNSNPSPVASVDREAYWVILADGMLI